MDEFTEASAEELLRAFAEEKGVKAGALINGSRVALTGQGVAPSLFASNWLWSTLNIVLLLTDFTVVIPPEPIGKSNPFPWSAARASALHSPRRLLRPPRVVHFRSVTFQIMSVLDTLLEKNLITKEDYREVKKQTVSGKVSLDQISSRAASSRRIFWRQKAESLNIPCARSSARRSCRSTSSTTSREEVGGALPVRADRLQGRHARGRHRRSRQYRGPRRPQFHRGEEEHSVQDLPHHATKISKKSSNRTKASPGKCPRPSPSSRPSFPSTPTQAVDAQTAQDRRRRTNAFIIEDAPVVKIVATIVRYATEGQRLRRPHRAHARQGPRALPRRRHPQHLPHPAAAGPSTPSSPASRCSRTCASTRSASRRTAAFPRASTAARSTSASRPSRPITARKS